VILLSLLSRSYPFFRAPDDMTALAELAAIFGTKAINQAAARYGRVVSVSHPTEPVTLSAVCKELAARGEVKPGTPNPAHLVTEEALGLVRALLALDYRERSTAGQALKSSYLKGVKINT